MTSRISFFKQMKEEWKHHLVSIFAVILVFLAEILFFYFDVSNVLRREQLIQSGIENISLVDVSALVPTMFLAMFLAAEYFSYLHSQKKTDFYMSLPMKRNTQFMMGMSVCLIMFFLPCAVAAFVETGIVVMTGYGSAVFLKNMVWMLLCKCLAFMVIWVTMALAVIITGHLAVAVMVFCMFCVYIPFLIKELYPTFANLFYETFVKTRTGDAWYYFSPVSLITGFANAYYQNNGTFYKYLTAAVIFTLIVGMLAWGLYQKRPAEAAGRAMAFEKANSVIRFLIVIPLALYCGYFLDGMAMAESRVWLIVGTVAGVILIHGIMESIYDFDPKKMFAKKKQALVTVGICLAFLAEFYLTADMYNGYLPSSEDVKSAKIVLNTSNVFFYEMDEQEGISGEQIETVLELAEKMILQNQKEEKDTEADGYSSDSICIKYEMGNGKEKGRKYRIDTDDEENRALLDQIFATKDFKEDFFEIYNIPNGFITEISLENTFESKKLWFSEKEQEEFLDIYRKELTKLTFTEMEGKARLAELSIKCGEGSWIEDCFIYENFDETIAFLKEHNIEVENPMEQCEVLSVELLDEYDEMGNPLYVITDGEILASVKNKFVLTDLYGLGYVGAVRNSEYAYAEIKTGNRIDRRYVYIREPELQFLKESTN